MPRHEYFEELAAIAALGELPASKLRQLREHLATCVECTTIHDDYGVLHAARPAMGTEMASVIESRRDIARTTLMQAIAARVPERATAAVRHTPRSAAGWWNAFTSAWATALVAAGLLCVFFVARGKHQVSASVSATAGSDAIAAAGSSTAVAANAGRQPIPVVASQTSATRATVNASEDESRVAKLENALLLEKQRSAKLEATLAEKERDLSAASGEKAALEQRVTAAAEESRRTESLLAAKTEQLQKLEASQSQDVTEMVALRYQVQDLTQKLDDQKQSLERESQLLASGRDIRDIIGARNLHIIDVYDTEPNGKTRASFARSFYTEGKSLIFYAYDLPTRHTEDGQFTYTAWGERNGNKQNLVNMGVLLNDDKGQRRWVLNFSDPKVLSEIDSVFITLERVGFEGAKPSGKRLLTAYLESQVNHP